MFSDQVRHRDWIIGVTAIALILVGMVWAQSGPVEPVEHRAVPSFDLAAADLGASVTVSHQITSEGQLTHSTAVPVGL